MPGGARLAGSSGDDESAEYVYNAAMAAGYDVSYQEITFQLVSDLTQPEFAQVAPARVTYGDGTDFATMAYSGSGDVTTSVSVPSGDFRGCNAADWAGFPAGNIALVSRGAPPGFPVACTFRLKAENAVAAGATAVVVYNNVPALLNGTLGAPRYTHSVLGITQALGQQLAALVPGGLTLRVKTDTVAENRTTRNVIAETPGGDPHNVVVVGAHLDSVSRGPGINDNGSGSAAILEIAEVYAAQDRTPRNKLRFMWYAAEEQSLLGSNYYVANLSADERDDIMAMLNFDMIGSPNFVRFVYDGDGSDTTPAGPPGSGFLEQVFVDYFDSQGLASGSHAVLGSLGLRAVHRRGHPGRRPVHGRRRRQDRGAAGDVRRDGGHLVRPVLPPRLRHVRQQQRHRPRPDVGCRRARGPAHVPHEDRYRGADGVRAPHVGLGGDRRLRRQRARFALTATRTPGARAPHGLLSIPRRQRPTSWGVPVVPRV